MKYTTIIFLQLTFLIGTLSAQRQAYITKNYTKKEVYITMRDGARLYTAIYSPKDNRIEVVNRILRALAKEGVITVASNRITILPSSRAVIER